MIKTVLHLTIAAIVSLGVLAPEGGAQSTASEPECAARDLNASFAFATTADHHESVVFEVQNTSDHACLLRGGAGAAFGDFAHGHSISTHECFACDGNGTSNRIESGRLVVLEPHDGAYNVYRWSTVSTSPESPCQAADGLNSFVNSDTKHPYSVLAPAFITQVCSVIEISSYRAGHFTGEDLAGTDAPSPAGHIELTTEKTTNNPGELVVLHIRSNGEGTPDESACPMLFFTTRSEDGVTQFQQRRAFQKCASPTDEEVKGTDVFGMYGAGTWTMTVSEMTGRSETGTALLLTSKPLEFHFRRDNEITRTWSPETAGLAIAFNIDQGSYTVGQDLHLHTAIRNVSATSMIYQYDCRLPVTYELSDSRGRVVESPYFPGICNADRSTSVELGKPVPMESTLAQLGILPNHGGEFSLVAVWNALQLEEVHVPPATTAPILFGERFKEYATVRSLPVLFRITEASK